MQVFNKHLSMGRLKFSLLCGLGVILVLFLLCYMIRFQKMRTYFPSEQPCWLQGGKPFKRLLNNFQFFAILSLDGSRAALVSKMKTCYSANFPFEFQLREESTTIPNKEERLTLHLRQCQIQGKGIQMGKEIKGLVFKTGLPLYAYLAQYI